MNTLIKYFFFYFLLLGISSPSSAEEPMAKEKKIKSAIVLNFIRYTEWPSSAFPSKSSEIHLCLYTNRAMEEAFSKLARGKLKDRNIKIRLLYRLNDLDECHVLYADRFTRKQALRAFSAIRTKPILTITEQATQDNMAGIINLLNKKGKLRFEIFINKAETAGLKISSRLLELSINN